MTRPILRRAAVLVPLGVLLAGCGSSSLAQAPATGPSFAASPVPTASASPSRPAPRSSPPIVPPSAPPSSPTDVLKPITVSGTVAAGTPEGCLVLTAGATSWLLRGPLTEDLAVGDQLTVTGRPAPGLRTECDGPPLLVRVVSPA